ncbi:LADA_0D07844g1_1 [Lachancea dasiensis]|uniref:H/ACA ribonucleoprotein complex non-core subunit NAF1 n=1 Tax=Lachancea dasiensis TaxID=1072105 RepID=A0A1G4J6K0_9SACH|nr:LADA_0D07844g1_1 [Lachancea dasiensis]
MSSDLFGEALKNPDAKPLPIHDDIDVGEISSDEEVPNVTQDKETKLQEEEPHDPRDTSGSGSTSSASETSASSEEADGSSSDESSDDSSGAEVQVMDEDDEDEEPAAQGPIKSKNELTEEATFEVPENFQITANTPIQEIGIIKSAFDHNIIVQSTASAEQRVLKEQSLLCLHDRQLLGPLCEVFGPLQAPFYRVSFPKAKSELYQELATKIGQKVFYIAPEAHWQDTFELRRLRGTDASNGFDEELPEDEQEFSDDEKEALHKKIKKQSKKRKGEVVQMTETVAGKKRVSTDFLPRSRPKTNTTPWENDEANSSSYRPRSARQNEVRASEQRPQVNSPYYHQQQQEHRFPPQQHTLPPQNAAGYSQSHSPYGAQTTLAYQNQGYPYPYGYQYVQQDFRQTHIPHAPQTQPARLPLDFSHSNYPQQYFGQPQGMYPQMQPSVTQSYHQTHMSPNPGYVQPQIPANPGYSHPQVNSTASFPQPQMATQTGFASEAQNMQQVRQLQQILMNQQAQQARQAQQTQQTQDQGNQHQNEQHF